MPGSTKGLIVYGSSGYTTLCFAKMMRSYGRTFSSKQLKDCLRGVFYEPGIHRAKSQLKSLHRNGYISKISEDEWEITSDGIDQIYRSVMGYRAQKERFLGKRYVSNINNQMAKIKRGQSIENFDEEEKILIAVENRMKQAKNKRSNQRARHRSRH